MAGIAFRVAGVTFEGRQAALGRAYDEFYTEGKEAQLRFGLRPEPDNEHDADAVAVDLLAPFSAPVGYVPRAHAAGVGRAIREGRVTAVRLESMNCGGRGAKVGLGLVVELDGPTGAAPGAPAAKTTSRKTRVEDDQGRLYELED